MTWGLILQGGGIRTAYTGGVLQYLAKRNLFPSVVAASSASVVNAVYYLAGQADWIDEVWTTSILGHVADVQWWPTKGYVFDNHVLMDSIIKGKYPLDVDAFKKRGIPCWTSVLDVHNHIGILKMLKADDIYDGILASIAHPFATPSPFSWGGQQLLDGAFYYPLPIEALFGTALDALVVVRTDNLAKPRNLMELTPLERAYLKLPTSVARLWNLHSERLAIEEGLLRDISQKLSVKVVSPSHTLPAKFVTRSVKSIEKNIVLGFHDAETQLKTFEF